MLMLRRLAAVAAVAIAAGVAATGITGCGLEPYGLSALGDAAAQPAASPAATGGQAPASAVPTVEATFTAAITTVASFGSPPAAYQVSVQSAVQTRQPIPGYSATMMSDLRASGLAAISQYFAPPQAAIERTALASALALDREQLTINLGSGVTRVSFGSVIVRGSVATISVRVTQWSRSIARKPLTGIWLTDAPVRILGYTATLRHAPGGSWQVTALASAPA
jgi:hypothetical protein